MATVELTFSALPAHVRTARLIATAVARRAGVAEDLLDEVRLAVGEACSRAVEAHRLHCPDEPVRIELSDDSGRFEVTVTDVAPSEDADLAGDVTEPGGIANGYELASLLPDMSGFGLAVIAGLAEDVEVYPSPKGMRVKMGWPAVSSLPSSA